MRNTVRENHRRTNKALRPNSRRETHGRGVARTPKKRRSTGREDQDWRRRKREVEGDQLKDAKRHAQDKGTRRSAENPKGN